ncbi:hypothetical protein B9Z19DRAFT_1096352 [Tuber borchii]|uniref:Uncharacterized protein n=1 Tax=Tuber borchii TaxID=42251 RepID=A0A2T6ZBK9_TUBBO|nr:hypothetical protein B9Z19DRAFT_1096352 [Tuber borchii]
MDNPGSVSHNSSKQLNSSSTLHQPNLKTYYQSSNEKGKTPMEPQLGTLDVRNCSHGRSLIFSVSAVTPCPLSLPFFLLPLFFPFFFLSTFVSSFNQKHKWFASFGDHSPLKLMIPLTSACPLPIPLNTRTQKQKTSYPPHGTRARPPFSNPPIRAVAMQILALIYFLFPTKAVTIGT